MPRMGPHGNGKMEKSKDFKGTLIKTFNNLGKWKYVLIFALGMATLSAILALVAPNKLSDLTDEITLGITPNISENIIKDIMTSDDITIEDKMALQSLMENLKNSGKELDDILLQLAERWNTIDFATQKYIATMAAGSRRTKCCPLLSAA